MSINYARVRDGKITPIRYIEKHLKFGKTLEMILATGDMVIPLVSSAPNLTPQGKPTFRDPSEFEIKNAIKTLADLDTELFTYHKGIEVASLDEDGDISIEQLPRGVVTYLGLWNPETNTPKLSNEVGRTGDMYQVVEGFPEDTTIDLGSGPVVVRSGMRLEYIRDRWVSTGFLHLSKYDRRLLDNVMVRNPNKSYGGLLGSEEGAYGIVSYPSILETLNGGVVVGQLTPVNCTRSEMKLHDNDGLDGLVYIPETGEIFLDADGVPPATYRPTFIVSSPLNRSDPIEVRIDVLEYTLETTSDEIVVSSGKVFSEPVISPQDPEPELHIVDQGELWSASISDDGKSVELDASFCVPGEYPVQVIAKGEKGESEVLTVTATVKLEDGQEMPSWSKGEIPVGALEPIAEEDKPVVRTDIYPLGSMPLD